MPMESPSNIFPNPSVSNIWSFRTLRQVFQDIFEISQFSSKIGFIGGVQGVSEIFVQLESSYLCYLGAHAKIRDPMISLPGIYLKLAHFPVKIGLIRGVRRVPEICFWLKSSYFFYLGVHLFLWDWREEEQELFAEPLSARQAVSGSQDSLLWHRPIPLLRDVWSWW